MCVPEKGMINGAAARIPVQQLLKNVLSVSRRVCVSIFMATFFTIP